MRTTRGHIASKVVLRSLVLLLAMAAAVAPAAARADGDAAQLSEAKALLTLGADAYNKGDYQSAWQHFVNAHELYRSPKIYFNIAQALVHLGRRAEAAEAFDAFLTATATDPKTDFSKKEEATNTLAKLSSDLAKVTLEVTPENARVTVDDRKVVAGPVYLLLDPSDHVFSALADGFQPMREHVVTQTAGRTNIVVRIHMVTAGPSAPAGVGANLPPPVATGPGLTALPVVHPETPSPTATPHPDVPPPGQPPADNKVLVAQNDGVPPTTATAAVAGSSTSEPNRLPAYLTLGGAGALAVAGTVVGLVAVNLGRTIGHEGGQCRSSATPADPRCGTWNTETALADVLVGGAIAAGVGGTILFIVAPQLGSSTGGSGGEVLMTGHF